MPLNFIHALKQHLERALAPLPKTTASDRRDDWSQPSLRDGAEYASVEYQRYHYGSAPGPFY